MALLDPVTDVARAVAGVLEGAGFHPTVRDGERWSWEHHAGGARLLVDVQLSPHLRWLRVARLGHPAVATVGLGVRHPVVDVAFARPMATGAWAVEGHVHTRLGLLLADGIDTWWGAAEAEDAAGATREVGLDWLDRHADPRATLAALQRDQADPFTALELAVVLGEREQALAAATRAQAVAANHPGLEQRARLEARWRHAVTRLQEG